MITLLGNFNAICSLGNYRSSVNDAVKSRELDSYHIKAYVRGELASYAVNQPHPTNLCRSKWLC